MTTLETIEAAPPGPILGLTEAFKEDPNPNKINLGAGVHTSHEGKTATLECIRPVEKAHADETCKADFSFVATQRGMFSFSGLDWEQVPERRDEHSACIVPSARTGVAGITRKNLEPLCNAIAAVP